ncbi:putative amidohydrolase [Shinella sp. BE166]|uniref:carbon-nitrogen hydrolase family protein n=1 Tax=Shinella sp. BE166 TaxID=3373918 RepID=UPI003EBDE63B
MMVAAVRDLRQLVNTPGPTSHIVNITSVDACAIEQDGPELEQVRLLCAKHSMEVVVGFLERVGPKLYNVAAIIGLSGVTGIHRKPHLPFLGADRFVDEAEGVDVSVFETAVGKVGVAICYEVRFPEVSRTLALAGADFIALPTNWPVRSVLLADCSQAHADCQAGSRQARLPRRVRAAARLPQRSLPNSSRPC